MTQRNYPLHHLRLEACSLAVGFFGEEPPDMAKLWSLVRFFELVLSAGAEAAKDEFGPVPPKATLRIVPK